jgi:hypothetical protein
MTDLEDAVVAARGAIEQLVLAIVRDELRRHLGSAREDRSANTPIDVSEYPMRNAILPCIGSERWANVDAVRFHRMPSDSLPCCRVAAQRRHIGATVKRRSSLR